MRLGILAGFSADWRDTLEKVKIAEDLGYEMVSTGEAWGHSVLPWLTVIAANTEKMQIGTGILNTFSRTPAAIAQEFATLETISGGRMVCGLGSSGNLVIEGFHGAEFNRPLRRIREYTEIIKMLLSGQRLQYEGEIYTLQRGFRLLGYEPVREDLPVWIAAITPRSIQQTGEIADGIYPIHWPKRGFEPLKRQLAGASRDAGRPEDSVTVAPFTNVFVTGEGDDEQVWRNARQPLFHYTNRMGSFYWQMLSRSGFESEIKESRAAWADRDSEGALMAFSESMVREIQVIGPIESVPEQLQARSDAGADLQMIPLPSGDAVDVGRRLEQFLGS